MRKLVAFLVLCGALTLALSYVSNRTMRKSAALRGAEEASNLAGILHDLREGRLDLAVTQLEARLDVSLALCEMNSSAEQRASEPLRQNLAPARAYRARQPVTVEEAVLRESVQRLLADP
jgi:hypothetical protein